MGRKATWILVSSAGFVILLCVGIVIYAAWVFMAGGRPDRLLAELKKKGEPVTISQIAPPRVPDRENAAILYAKAFELLPKGNGGKDIDFLGEFVRGGYRRWDRAEWKQARTLVARHGEALRIAAEAARLPKCRYPVDYAAGWQAPVPHLRSLKTLVVLAAASAIVKAGDADQQAAILSLKVGLSAAESVRDEPLLISFLNRVGNIKRVSRALAALLGQGRMSSEQAERLGRDLDRIDFTLSYVRVLKGERVTVITELEGLPEAVARESTSARSPGGRDNRTLLVPAKTALRAVLSRDEVYYIRGMNERIGRADEPYYRRARAIKSAREANSAPRYSLISANMLKAVDDSVSARDEAVAAISASRIMLKLAICRSRSGSYPATLAELRDKLGWTPPTDPFSGRDFIYKRQGQCFLLYSIGPNLKDDGGVGAEPSRRRSSAAQSGDLVWRLDIAPPSP